MKPTSMNATSMNLTPMNLTPMKLIYPLMLREWFQYRFAWLMTAVIPLALAVLLLSVGHIEFDGSGADPAPPAQALAAAATAITCGLMMLLYTVTGLVTVIALARRDHADRSVEFWLSLPVGHTRSFAVPMGVHLVLLPLAALGLGLLASVVTSALLVSRVHGFSAWLALPWGDVLTLAATMVVRVVAGWPLAVLWVLPVVLVAMLMFAWLRRWGLVILGLALALAVSPLGELWGAKWLPQAVAALFAGAARSIVSGHGHIEINDGNAAQVIEVLSGASQWLWLDIIGSIRNLASPLLVGAWVVAALCFVGLVQWRRRGASAAV